MSPWHESPPSADAALSPQRAHASFDTPRSHFEAAATRMREEDDCKVEERVVKRRRLGTGLSSALASTATTALRAAIFTGAIGYAADTMWRGSRQVEEQRPPPPYAVHQHLSKREPRHIRVPRRPRPRRSFVQPTQTAPLPRLDTFAPHIQLEELEEDDDGFGLLNRRIQDLLDSGRQALAVKAGAVSDDEKA